MTMPTRPSRSWRPWVIGGSVLIALLVLAGAGTAVAIFAASNQAFHYGTTLAAGSRVRVSIDDASVRVHPATDGKVRVQVDGHYRGTTPKADARPEPGGVVVDVSCAGSGIHTCDITVDISLPPANELSVVDTDGSVNAESLSGNLSLRTSDGDINVTDARSATVTAISSDGSESLAFAIAPTSVTAHNSDGDITVIVPGTESYALRRSTNDGSTNVSVPEDPASHHRIDANTSDGDITIKGS